MISITAVSGIDCIYGLVIQFVQLWAWQRKAWKQIIAHRRVVNEYSLDNCNLFEVLWYKVLDSI